ncbi:MAG: ComEC/Rec2 family competence protein [Actinobacteria bacterium]|nr:ComEC/Rec2 family competence protein [Actinomycetota bacterium]
MIGKFLRTYLNIYILPIIVCLTFFISIVVFLIYRKKNACATSDVASVDTNTDVDRTAGQDTITAQDTAAGQLTKTGPQNLQGILPVRILLIIASFNFLVIGLGCSYFYYYKEDKNIFQNLYDYGLRNPDTTIVVEGRISTHPEIKKGYLLFMLCSQKIILQNTNGTQGLSMESNDIINVKLKTANYYSFKRDDFIKGNGLLNLRDDGDLTLILEDFHTEKIPTEGLMPFFYNFRKRTYECISGVYYDKLGTGCAGIATALILGNDNFVSNLTLQNFKHSGAYHLLAISGQHISFFIYLLVSFLKFAGPGLKKLYLKNIFIMLLILLFLIFYNFLVGQKASALRASMMAILIILAGFWERESSGKFVLSMTYMFLLAVFPGFLNNIGFWLSFAAMAAILYINGIFAGLVKKICKKLKGRYKLRTDYNLEENYFIRIFITTFSINVFIMPVLLYFFKEFSLIALLTNILIIPVFYPLLFILILSSAFSLFWPPIGSFLILPAKPFILYILKIVNFFGRKNFFILTTENTSYFYLVIYYLLLFILLFLLNKYVETD